MSKAFVEFVRTLYDSNDFIPLHSPVIGEREKALVNECLNSTFVSSVGAFVDQFERDLAQYTGAKYAIATVNGTSALHMALLLAGVERDTQVITQAFSFVATANAIHYCGAEPVFLDVDETLGLSPQALNAFLNNQAELRENGCFNRVSGKKIAACVPMHTFGHPCKIDEIGEICRQWQMPLVEDAAESLGSFYQSQHTGTFGLLGAFSFNGNKIATAGGGGAIVTHDEALAKRAKHLTTTAKVPHKWAFNHDEVGYNYRMPNLNAALLCAQLEQLDAFIANKRQTAQAYADFSQTQPWSFCAEPAEAASNYWLNAILLDDEKTQPAFLDETNQAGVMTRPAWTPLHQLPMYAHCQRGDLSRTESMFKRIVNVPSSVRL